MNLSTLRKHFDKVAFLASQGSGVILGCSAYAYFVSQQGVHPALAAAGVGAVALTALGINQSLETPDDDIRHISNGIVVGNIAGSMAVLANTLV